MKKSTYLIGLALGASTLTFAQVGIGTSTPSSPLDIEADDAAIDLNNTAADGDPALNFQLSGTTTFSIGIDDGDSDKLKIGTTAPDASTSVTIDGSGNVGIGTTSPTATLDVDGSAIFNESGASVDFRVEGDAQTHLLFVDGSADMVGIGTASPTSIVDIAVSDNTYAWTVTANEESDFGLYAKILDTQPPSSFGTTHTESGRIGWKHNTDETNGFISFYRGPGDFGGFLGFSTNGTEKMIVSPDGEVGIGTGTADLESKLEIITDDNEYAFLAENTNQPFGLYAKAINTTAFSETYRLGLKYNSTETNGYISFYRGGTDAGGWLRFATNGTEVMEIDPNGDVGIGVTASTEKLQVAGNIAPGTDDTYDLGTAGLRWDDVFATSGLVNTSDRRLKTNIDSLNYGLAELMKLTPVRFNWKTDTANIKDKIGFIAQEVQSIIPEVVHVGDDENQTLGIYYADMVSLLTSAIQEQQVIIESLKKENEIIKAEASSSKIISTDTAQKLAALEAKLNALLLQNSKGAVLTAEN